MAIKKEPDPQSRTMLADPILLEKIDKLFAYNIGEYISLPQLVVVGDQSSGKSSVLEGLTKLSFPRDSGLCTRFATQIIFRRDGNLIEREISASIIPTVGIDATDEQNLKGWKASGIQTLSERGFSQTMKEVHEIMGLSVSENDGKSTFSNNVLRLEIRGPDENHLSVIDVPGIFSNTTPGRTTKNDMSMVKNMVLRYMENPRSIMLTVVPANVDIATQQMIEMAREVDPEGIRTLRILTKPDLVYKAAENKVIDLVEGQNASGQLGWIVVRNLGQQQLEDGDVDRDLEEDAFHPTAPWNRLRTESYGIKALRNRLQEILGSSVRREFPSVRAEVSKELKASKKSLEILGRERENPEQQRSVLLEIVSRFQGITQQALTTNYGACDKFDVDQSLRLATLVVNRNSLFEHELAFWGHEYAFESQYAKKAGEDQSSDEQDGAEDSHDSTSENDSHGQDKQDALIRSRKTEGRDDLRDILHESMEISRVAKQGISSWIQKLYHEACGFEIGTFSPSLLSTLMKKQSTKWPILAQGHISDIITIVHNYICKALTIACCDSKIFSQILSLLMDDLLEKYRQAMSMTDFLLRIERESAPMTLNHYLNDNLRKWSDHSFTFTL